MPDYDFSTINASDFEKLACDLLNREAHKNSSLIRYRIFKEGRDKGIDLLYSSSDNIYEVVGQVKHFTKSTYSSLKSSVKAELQKLDILNPTRYIFITSQPLSVENKIELKNILAPYLHHINDIYGREDINLLLGENRDIEESHFKLWFSSSLALKNIMEYKYKGRSDEYEEHILKKKLRLFVKTPQVDQAEDILASNKFLIITGNPGVGKTTLSDILVYKHISKGFKLGIILESIHELETMLKNDNSKQLFYYDDFLGHTQAEIEKSKEAESLLLRLISRIEHAENKYLILNTRKFILSDVIESSERFRNFRPLRGESKLELTAYSYGAKRRMLDNHLIESELNEQQKAIVAKYAYFICSHINFSPRLLEFFCSKDYIQDFSPYELEISIQSNLANPKDIWEHAYWEQISDYDRILLNTLYSLNSRAQQGTLEEAFNKRIDYEVFHNNFRRPLKAFSASLKRLNGGFIDIYPTGKTNRINFINPSLEDYLDNTIRDNAKEIERILFSSGSLKPWLNLYRPFKSKRNSLPSNLLGFLKENYMACSEADRDSAYQYKVSIFFFYFEPQSYKFSFDILKKIYRWEIISDIDIPYHIDFLNLVSTIPKFRELIAQFPITFFIDTLYTIKTISEIERTIPLLGRFGFDLISKVQNIDQKSKTYKDIKLLREYFEGMFEAEIKYQYEELMNNTETDLHLDILEQLDHAYELILSFVNPEFEVDYTSLTSKDWNTIARENLIRIEIFGEKITAENYENFEKEYVFDEYENEYDKKLESIQLNVHQIIDINEPEIDDLPF